MEFSTPTQLLPNAKTAVCVAVPEPVFEVSDTPVDFVNVIATVPFVTFPTIVTVAEDFITIWNLSLDSRVAL